MIETMIAQETKSTVIPFRVRPSEFDQVKHLARQDRLPVSEWVRRVVLAEITPMKGSEHDD